MVYPRILIDTAKIYDNVKTLVEMAKENGMEVVGVTKGFCAQNDVVKAYIEGGVTYIADSRIKNLKRLEQFEVPKILIRIPMISEAEDTVRYADISLNSEVETIKALSNASIKLNKTHSIILMMDLGDLREGYFTEDDLYKSVAKIKDLPGIKIVGLGANFTCYGGVNPNKRLLDKLVFAKDAIELKYGIKLDIISGGNSSTVHLFNKENLKGINNIRLGEAIICGTESAYGKLISGTHNDAFILETEVVEVKEKPSVPTEKIGRDAFGNIPTFEDRGIRKRIICGIGKQDTDFETMYPFDKDLIVLGGSSDHLILDGSDCEIDYKVGDIIRFKLHYVSILRLMTSEYVDKVIL